MNRSPILLIAAGVVLGAVLGLAGQLVYPSMSTQDLNETLSGYGASVTTCERQGRLTWVCAVVKPTHSTICTPEGCSPLAPLE